MKNILLLTLLLWSSLAFSVCSTISRSNYGFGVTLQSATLNSDLNTVYARVNDLPGDCLTDETVTSAKILDGTIANTDIATGAITPAKLSGSNYVIAATDSASFSTTSATYVDVTNQSVSITTNGRPVIITLVNGTLTSSFATGSAISWVKAVRDSTDLAEKTFAIAAGSGIVNQGTIDTGSFVWYDAPSAGTYTYKIQAKSNSSSITTSITSAKLFVREL